MDKRGDLFIGQIYQKTNSSTTDVSPKNAAYHHRLFCLLKGISSKNEKDSELIGMGKYNYIQFYIAKLGYAGVYLFFLFLLRGMDCGCSVEPPRQGESNVCRQSVFLGIKGKNITKTLLKFSYFSSVISSVYCMNMYS